MKERNPEKHARKSEKRKIGKKITKAREKIVKEERRIVREEEQAARAAEKAARKAALEEDTRDNLRRENEAAYMTQSDKSAREVVQALMAESGIYVDLAD